MENVRRVRTRSEGRVRTADSHLRRSKLGWSAISKWLVGKEGVSAEQPTCGFLPFWPRIAQGTRLGNYLVLAPSSVSRWKGEMERINRLRCRKSRNRTEPGCRRPCAVKGRPPARHQTNRSTLSVICLQGARSKSGADAPCRRTALGIEAWPTGHQWMTGRQGRTGFKRWNAKTETSSDGVSPEQNEASDASRARQKG